MMHIRKLFALWAFMLVVGSGQAQHNRVGSLTTEDGLSDGSVRSILRDRKGFVWMGTMRGVDRFDGSRVVNIPFGETFADGEQNAILSMKEEDDEHLLAWNISGKWRVDKRRLTIERIEEAEDGRVVSKPAQAFTPSDVSDHQGFPFRFAASSLDYLDEMGVFWRCYNFFGVDYTYYTTGIFSTFEVPGVWSSAGQQVRSFLLDGSRVLVGTRQGLFVVDRAEGSVRSVSAEDLGATIITQIKRVGQQYYVATVGGGIRVLDSSSLRSSGVILPDAAVYQMVDHGADLWACTSQGLLRLSTRKASPRSEVPGEVPHLYSTRNSQLPDDEVFCIGFDRDGRGWLSTKGGPCLYDPQADALTTKNIPRKVRELGMLRTVSPWSDDSLLLIPQTGFPVVYASDGTLSQLTSDVGDASPVCLGVLPLGESWSAPSLLVTANGLYLDQKVTGVRRFSYLDGLPNEQFQSHAFAIDEQGCFWAATNGGLVFAHVDRLAQQKHHPIPIILQEVQTDHWFTDAEVNAVIYDSLLHLSRHDNCFTVKFAPLVAGNTRDLQFRYKLEGHDGGWRLAGHDRRISYEHLRPGRYTLLIIGEGRPEMTMAVTVDVPLTVFALAWIALALLLSALIAHVVYCRLKKKEYFWQRLMPKPAKYQKSRVDQRELDEMGEKLRSIMEKDKPYLQPNLQMGDLAQLVGCSSHMLSQVFSQSLKTTYYDFVADYRIREFKRLALLPEKAVLTISALAEECGFRSRNPFLVAFKKQTGLSPREWLKQAKANG